MRAPACADCTGRSVAPDAAAAIAGAACLDAMQAEEGIAANSELRPSSGEVDSKARARLRPDWARFQPQAVVGV